MPEDSSVPRMRGMRNKKKKKRNNEILIERIIFAINRKTPSMIMGKNSECGKEGRKEEIRKGGMTGNHKTQKSFEVLARN